MINIIITINVINACCKKKEGKTKNRHVIFLFLMAMLHKINYSLDKKIILIKRGIHFLCGKFIYMI